MYSFPFNFRNIDLITSALQLRAHKFLNSTSLCAEQISAEELKIIVPSLFDQFKELGIVFDVARFFITPPGQTLPIHHDGTNEYPKFWALNLPIYNCKNTSMIWYKTKSEVHYRNELSYSYAPIPCYSEKECIEIERCHLEQPTWVKVDIPHAVDNPVNQGNRIIISLRFDVSALKDWTPFSLPSLTKI